jgi:serine/threonine protein kinase
MYQQVHLTLALQIAKTLSRINVLNLVHGDMRLENILVRLTKNGPEAILGDFGLTEDVGSFTARALGFFPPPETQPQKRQPQDMRADTGHDASQPSQAEQAPCGSKIDLNVDGWALGIVFFTLFHGFSFDVDGLSFKHDRETILRNREQLIALLAPEGADAVDDLIRRLLDIVPTRRSLSFHAVQALEKIMPQDK